SIGAPAPTRESRWRPHRSRQSRAPLGVGRNQMSGVAGRGGPAARTACEGGVNQAWEGEEAPPLALRARAGRVSAVYLPRSPHIEPLLQSTGPVAVETLSPAEEAFERWRRRVGVVLAPLAFVAVQLLATGLSGEGRTLAAILAAVVVLWVTETMPLAVTALLGAVLAVVLGVAPAKQVFAHFGDPIIFLFIGSFILA